MPSPRFVYQSIARGLRPTASYVAGERGQPQRVHTQPTMEGVAQLDRLIQERLRDDPKLSYDAAVASLTINGEPIKGTLLVAARQLQEARRQKLLLPGDERLD